MLNLGGTSAIVGGRTELADDPFGVEPMIEGVLLGMFRVKLRSSVANQSSSSDQPGVG